MSSNTEFEVRADSLEAAQGSDDSTQTEEVTVSSTAKGGDPDLVTEQQTEECYLCDTVEEFRELEAEIGVAARWTRPRKAGEPPTWVSRWRWEPEDGLGWPTRGNDVY
jgi:hypothetical protein